MEKSNLIKDNHLVKVKKIGNDLELYNINTCNYKPTIKKLQGRKHIILRTGEIVEEKQSLLRGENTRTLLESNIRLRDLIKENTIELWKTLLITLTYRDKILDIKKIKLDFKHFINYLRKHFTQFGNIEYIQAIEPFDDLQGYHLHAILFFNDSKAKVFMDFEVLEKAWKNGFASICQPKDEKSMYLYITPHLENEVSDKNIDMHQKALNQMQLPAGTNLYSYSKGIRKPQIWTDNYAEVKKYLVENKYVYQRENIYKNEMSTIKGNNLYYCKEFYKKEMDVKPKRKPI